MVEIDKAIRTAYEYLQKGKLTQAENICRELLNISSVNADAYFILGNIFQSRNQFDDAMGCYREIIRINPHNFSAHFQLGVALYNRRRLSEAEASLLSALQLNPNYDEAYTCLGMIYREEGRFPEAEHDFQKALQLNPKSSWIYTNLGALFQAKGQRKQAQTCFKKALEYNPNIRNHYDDLRGLLKEAPYPPDTVTPPNETSALSILVAIPVRNRKKIVQLSLAQTKRYKTSSCHLQVYNDHSTEFGNSFLKPYADEVIQLPEKMGIDNLRWHQFRKFLETDFDCLYMTDSDVVHDPNYIAVLERLYRAGKAQLPVSLFNGIFTMQPRMILYCKDGMFLKTSAPGNSMFYDRNMVENIVDTLDKTAGVLDYLPWDNKAVACLGLPWIAPEVSYLEHFGAQGVNNDNYERDRAINPTEYLQSRRGPILQYLTEGNDLQINW